MSEIGARRPQARRDRGLRERRPARLRGRARRGAASSSTSRPDAIEVTVEDDGAGARPRPTFRTTTRRRARSPVEAAWASRSSARSSTSWRSTGRRPAAPAPSSACASASPPERRRRRRFAARPDVERRSSAVISKIRRAAVSGSTTRSSPPPSRTRRSRPTIAPSAVESRKRDGGEVEDDGRRARCRRPLREGVAEGRGVVRVELARERRSQAARERLDVADGTCASSSRSCRGRRPGAPDATCAVRVT